MALVIASCDNDDWKPGTPSSPDGEKVYFSDENENNFVLALNDDKIELIITRDDATEEADIPVMVASPIEGMFTGAETVTFAAGEREATYTVTVSDAMLPFQSYKFSVIIPEKYTAAYQYDENSLSPRIDITVLKEDFAVVGTGLYNDPILFEQSWPQDIEYSPMLGLYRLPNLIVRDTPIYFHFAYNEEGEQEFYFTDSEGKHVTKMATGYVYGSYGMITMGIFEEKGLGYDEEDIPEGYVGQFYFYAEYSVTQGSFGEGWETMNVSEWYEKPWATDNAEGNEPK